MRFYNSVRVFAILGLFLLAKEASSHDDPAVFPHEVFLRLADLLKQKKVVFCECRAIEGFGENPIVRLERGVVGTSQRKIFDRCMGNFKKESIDQIELIRCEEL